MHSQHSIACTPSSYLEEGTLFSGCLPVQLLHKNSHLLCLAKPTTPAKIYVPHLVCKNVVQRLLHDVDHILRVAPRHDLAKLCGVVSMWPDAT